MKKILTSLLTLLKCSAIALFLSIGVLTAYAVALNDPLTKDFFAQFFAKDTASDLYMNGKGIKNLSVPSLDNDAARRIWVQTQIRNAAAICKTTAVSPPILTTDSALNTPLTINPVDSITTDFFSKFFIKNTNQNLDMNSRRVRKVPSPINDNDAVSKEWVAGQIALAKPSCCSNDCNIAGQTRCSGSYAQSCGYYDADRCLEWNTGTNCTNGCVSGICNISGPCLNCRMKTRCLPPGSCVGQVDYANRCGAWGNFNCSVYQVCPGTYNSSGTCITSGGCTDKYACN